MLLSRTLEGSGQKRAPKPSARARGAPQVGDPVEELYSRAGALLQEAGTVPAPLLAAVVKMELAAIRKQASVQGDEYMATCDWEISAVRNNTFQRSQGLQNIYACIALLLDYEREAPYLV